MREEDLALAKLLPFRAAAPLHFHDHCALANTSSADRAIGAPAVSWAASMAPMPAPAPLYQHRMTGRSIFTDRFRCQTDAVLIWTLISLGNANQHCQSSQDLMTQFYRDVRALFQAIMMNTRLLTPDSSADLQIQDRNKHE